MILKKSFKEMGPQDSKDLHGRQDLGTVDWIHVWDQGTPVTITFDVRVVNGEEAWMLPVNPTITRLGNYRISTRGERCKRVLERELMGKTYAEACAYFPEELTLKEFLEQYE